MFERLEEVIKTDKFNIIDLLKEWLIDKEFNITLETRNSLSATRSNIEIAFYSNRRYSNHIIGFAIKCLDKHYNSGRLYPADPGFLNKLEMILSHHLKMVENDS